MKRPSVQLISSREGVIVAFVFTLLTIALTWPQVPLLQTHVGMHYDALFSIWRLAWIAHQLPRDPWHLFDANAFYPATGTLAYSDAILLPGLVAAPAIWLDAHPVTVYNVIVLLAFVSSGVGMYVFVRGIGCGTAAAAFGAVSFAFQPYRFAHYPQLELLWTCWIPLALLALHRAIAKPTWRTGLWLGLCVTLQALSCLYYFVFLVTAMVLVAPVLALRERRDVVNLWKPALVAVAITTVVVAPYLLPYARSNEEVGMRTLQDVQEWSPTLQSYVTAQFGSWLYPDPPPHIDPFEKVLLPGATLVLCALAGLVSGPRRYAIAYGLLALVAFDLSLGTNGLLYGYLFETVWVYQGLRVPARLFVLVSLALSTLAALGLMRWTSGRRGWLVAAPLVALCIAETASTPIELRAVDRAPATMYRWLATQPRGPVLEWPTPSPDSLGVTQEPRYMYLSTFHWQPLVNGYSGHYPDTYLELLHYLKDFPGPGSIEAIQRLGVRYLILHSQPDPAGYVSSVESLSKNKAVRFHFAEPHGGEEVTLYTVEPPAR